MSWQSMGHTLHEVQPVMELSRSSSSMSPTRILFSWCVLMILTMLKHTALPWLGGLFIGADISDYRYGIGLVHFRDFHCRGNEPNITSCYHDLAGYSCGHSTDVGVSCRGIILSLLFSYYVLSCHRFVKLCC